MRLTWPRTLFGRLGWLLVLIPTLNLVAIFIAAFAVAWNPGGHQFALMSSALALVAGEAAEGGGTAAWAERLERHSGATVGPLPAGVGEPPATPFFAQWRRHLERIADGEVKLGFQAGAPPTLWLWQPGRPRHAVGVPLVVPIGGLWSLVLIWLLSSVLALAVAWWIARHLDRPLHELAEATRRLGRDLRAVEVNPRGPAEVRAVADALNRMSADLHHLIREQELLVAGVSHDLRTPLTRLRLGLEMLEATPSEIGAGMGEDIEEMDGIVQQFTELARFNIEETEPWAEGDPRPLLEEVGERYGRAGFELGLECAPLPVVRYKPLALRRLLYNLVDNAFKHGGGPVTLGGGVVDGRVRLTVADRGPGLAGAPPPGETPRLAAGGRGGLGAFIVRRIAKLHDAEVAWEERPGGGLEVSVLFPPGRSTGESGR